MKYIIARNRSGRPTLQHAMGDYRSRKTLCGRDVSGWSRAWSDQPIKIMLCRRCREADEANQRRHLRRAG